MRIPEKYLKLSGFALKRIAVISMIVDHFGSIIMDGIIAPYKVNDAIYFTADMPFMVRNAYIIRGICEALGSIAFPLFCFLIAEGFMHTRERVRYGVRVGAFALLSEIPYDIAHYQTLCSFRLQNVMFTLTVGIFTLLAISRFQEQLAGKKSLRIIGVSLITAAGMGLAFLIRGEYVFLGVLAICLLYLLRDKGWLRFLGFAPLLPASPWILLALIPAALYNGQRGTGSKYFFYIFYPAHFLLFAYIAYVLAARPI